MYSAYGEGPPCGRCRPELMDCNVPFFILYEYVQDQMIVGMSGPVALNMLAVNQGMIDYQVAEDERITFSRRVRRIANEILHLQYEESERKRKEAKKKKR